MQLRKLRAMLIPVLTAAVAFAGSSPATAGTGGQGLAVGVVNGTVNTNPGVPVDPTNPTAKNTNNFTFVSTTIIGTVSVADGPNVATYAGNITVGASGTAHDTAAFGIGKVTALGGSGTSATGSISVSLKAGTTVDVDSLVLVGDNTFVRVGPEVLVILKLDVTITGPLGTTVSGLIRVVVVATFVPTDPTTSPINQALFAGTFTGGPALP